ncbi:MULTISPECIES: hypothetical protein [Cysteiniphilum]|uniref:hypothetical protein n=1 Tax=Cysteiniphilum TaxID=2056696 RepID=UPI00177FC9BC|nr:MULTISPECIES: hypothetical protein [Cysteiniphilum]
MKKLIIAISATSALAGSMAYAASSSVDVTMEVSTTAAQLLISDVPVSSSLLQGETETVIANGLSITGGTAPVNGYNVSIQLAGGSIADISGAKGIKGALLYANGDYNNPQGAVQSLTFKDSSETVITLTNGAGNCDVVDAEGKINFSTVGGTGNECSFTLTQAEANKLTTLATPGKTEFEFAAATDAPEGNYTNTFNITLSTTP